MRLLEGFDARNFKEEWDPSPAAFGILDFNDLGMAHVHAEGRTVMEEVGGMTHACSVDPAAPMPEGTGYGICSGQALELARCAIGAAELGAGEDAWRRLAAWLAIPPRIFAASEECLRESGLWPRASGGRHPHGGRSACADSVGARA